MRAFVKFLVFILVISSLTAAAMWVWAGRAEGPRIEIRQPAAYIGQASTADLMIEAPEGLLTRVDVTLEQGGKAHSVFTLDGPTERQEEDGEAAERLYVMRPIGKRAVPELQEGPARLVIRAARPVLYGLREVESVATRDVQVRLQPPRIAVVSRFHYINHGGAEFVVYRAAPAEAESGVAVGDRTYPGFPATGAGIQSDGELRVAFFALPFEQALDTPIAIFARDLAGNEARTPVDSRAFAKPVARSRIELDDRFLQRVVSSIAAQTADMQLSTAEADLLASFLRINGDLRRRNNQTVAELAQKTAPIMSWKDAFVPLGNASVEARFADNRTYVYKGKEVDRQVHLGFDLAVTAQVPIVAAQSGVVVHAGDLGIYGNCVVIDHGLGVQSLYGHLSTLDVKVGDKLERGQMMGRSGMTGLAGGDHLHFTVLVHGQPVNPVEWWDPKWIQDRVLRKVAEAGVVG
jgi:murein DD-endopeptidase MepM/ murein hydrolase activator NlpD